MPFATDGRWTGVQQTPGDSHSVGDGLGVFVIHATLLRTGEVLWFSGHTEDSHYLTESWVWDPTQPVNTAVRQAFPAGVDLFCGHHANLDDGRVITVGGAMSSPHGRGIRDICVFNPDPAVRTWTKIGDMQHGRWYPTLVTLPDGRLVVFSGRTESGASEFINSTVELLNPPFAGPGYTPTVLAGANKTYPTYPGLHLVVGGRIVHSGPTWRYEDIVTAPIRTFSFRLTSDTSGAWTDEGVGPSVPLREEGMSVLLPPAQDGRILVIGGADANLNGGFGGLASGSEPRAAEICDTRTSPPSWTRIGDTTHPRINVNAVLLPDGKVLVIGGHNQFKFENSSVPSNQSEIYDPVLNAWAPAATMGVPRMYHSAGLLLPDGRVVVAGGFDPNGPGDGNRKSFEIYEPPYFFNSDDSVAVRSTITSIAAIDGPTSQIAYGGRFIINTPDALNIRKVSLMRPGSSTHHTDAEQRYVALDFVLGPGPNQLTAQVPNDPSVAPPGYYMVWIVDLNNRPCQRAQFVRLLRSRCFVIIDRSHYSKDEVNATPPPATNFDDAFYVVMDGFLPSELGITSATPTLPPPTPLSPVITFRRSDASVVNEITATPLELLFEFPTLPPGVRQRFTFKYRLTINGTAPFFQPDGTTAIEMQNITLEAALSSYVGRGNIRLHHQPNPFMLDGATPWLSIDLQVFKVKAGEGRFGQPVHGTTDASANTFIENLLTHFNTNEATGIAEFNGLMAASTTTELDWSYTRGGDRVFNYAIAKVRYRGIALPATDVRVFFRLFTVAATGTEFRANTTYKTLTNVAGDPIPVLGLVGPDIGTMPFFASPRVNTSFQRLTDQTDIPNRKTIAAIGAGTEKTTFFGCWLDFNNTVARYPWHPADAIGPYASGLQSIQTLINGRHQCLVAEIYFNPNPLNPLVLEGDNPGSSDKLAQRNLAITYSTNPGTSPTRTVQHTFELRPPRNHKIGAPSTAAAAAAVHVEFNEGPVVGIPPRRLSDPGPDELMILWNTLPRGTEAEFFLPQLTADAIVDLAALHIGPGRVEKVDEHTIRCRVADVSYIPLPPFGPGNLAGLITLRLPTELRFGQVFRVLLQQFGHDGAFIGTFELMVRVEHAENIAAEEANTLAVLKHVMEVRPVTDRWYPIFERWLGQLVKRVDSLGIDPGLVEPSPLGTDGSPLGPDGSPLGSDGLPGMKHWQWCRLLGWLVALAVALLLPITKWALNSNNLWLAPLVMVLVLFLIYLWNHRCKPSFDTVVTMLILGLLIGSVLLALV